MKEIINEHDLLFQTWKAAFVEYAQLQLESAVLNKKDPTKVYTQLKNDLRRYKYAVGTVCKRRLKNAKGIAKEKRGGLND